MTVTQIGADASTVVEPATAVDRPRVPRAVPVAIVLAWAALVALHLSGHGGSIDHDTLLGPGGNVEVTSLLVYAAAWITMITAMMLPSAVPLLGLFASVSRSQPRAGLVVAAFVSGYLAVWTVFGCWPSASTPPSTPPSRRRHGSMNAHSSSSRRSSLSPAPSSSVR